MARARKQQAPDHEVLIIGAGFSGMGAAIKLKARGVDDILILERNAGVGGTWRHNTYPGVAVDIPSVTYSYHFEPNPNWSRAFAPGSELRSYADSVADKYDLRRHLRTGVDVVEATFDDEQHLWRVRLDTGETITGRFLLSCHGALVTPLKPTIAGVDDFAGHVIATMRWDHDYDLTGKRVAIIGTGATALQVIPEIAERVEHLDVYQRTPIWVLPKVDPPINAVLRRVFATVPLTQHGARLAMNVLTEVGLTVAVVHNRQLPGISKSAERIGLRHLRSQVKDQVLREKLTPHYGFGCKRPSFSNTYYPALSRDDVDVITTPIERVTARGIVTADGREREIDVLILATGFKVFDVPYALRGLDGEALGERWERDRYEAYEGVSVPGYPNMFLSPGPYGVSGFSWFSTIDMCNTHAVRTIVEARKRGATRVEVRREAYTSFVDMVRARKQNTIFVNPSCTGSNSYYIDHHGDAPFLRPSSGVAAWLAARRFDLNDYAFGDAPGPRPMPARAARDRVTTN